MTRFLIYLKNFRTRLLFRADHTQGLLSDTKIGCNMTERGPQQNGGIVFQEICIALLRVLELQGEYPVGEKLAHVNGNKKGKLFHIGDLVGEVGKVPEMDSP